MQQHGWTWKRLCEVQLTSQRKTNAIWFHLYVEFNEQTELTSNIETDSQIENRMTAYWGRERVVGGGTKQKGKRTHGHGRQCGDYKAEGSIRR